MSDILTSSGPQDIPKGWIRVAHTAIFPGDHYWSKLDKRWIGCIIFPNSTVPRQGRLETIYIRRKPRISIPLIPSDSC